VARIAAVAAAAAGAAMTALKNSLIALLNKLQVLLHGEDDDGSSGSH
jgi:hypothetical protein